MRCEELLGIVAKIDAALGRPLFAGRPSGRGGGVWARVAGAGTAGIRAPGAGIAAIGPPGAGGALAAGSKITEEI